MAPPYLQGLFQYSTDVTGHHDHNPNCLYVPQMQNNYGGALFRLKSITLLNLPIILSRNSF